MKTLITYICIGYTAFAFSQNNTPANLSFGRPPDCSGYQGSCTFTTGTKNNANASVSYREKTGELIITINKDNTTLDQLEKLTHNKVKNNTFLYTFDSDYMLPQNVIIALKLPQNTYIKAGDYPVVNQEKHLIITVKTNLL